jgi:hypothetical protein
MAFSLVQILYWIGLSTWFGGVLFIAIAAPIVFRVVKEANPILPTVLSVNLEGQHSSLLAGTIVTNLISQLVVVELICAGVLLPGIVGHWWLTDVSQQNWLLPLVRTGMYVGLVGFVAYDWRVLWPKINRFRNEYIEHADEPDVANPANDEFNRLQQESELLLRIRLALLLGLILFSASISQRRVSVPIPAGEASAGFGQQTQGL